MTDPKTQVVGVLSSEEVVQLKAIEAELHRMVMIHEALTEKRLSTMRSVVLSRGEDLKDNYSIDTEKGLLIKHAPDPDAPTPDGQVDAANGSKPRTKRPRPTAVEG